ncbi:MAG: SRPBCC domain-containing protein [Planctomycetota bacterium]
MAVKREESGRRSVEVEVHVPGTPEEVWQAIATGPGVSSWFARCEIEERAGGSVACHMGPGMESVGTLTAWDPPRRFAAEGQNFGPDAPTFLTEWIVEARSGGSCLVRVVHSLLADEDDWDAQLECIESGWPGFFGVLRLYLAQFRGQSCSIVRAMGSAAETEPRLWEALATALGIASVAEGRRFAASSSDMPPLAGIVERIGAGGHRPALLRLEDPGPGIALASVFTMEDRTHAAMGLYLYGDEADAIAARDEPLWQAWMAERFLSSHSRSGR